LPGEVRWVLASRGLAPYKLVKPVGIEQLPQTPAVELAATELERYEGGGRGRRHGFTVRGARVARRITEQAGWSQYRIDLTAQVITLNANGRVSPRWGAEAYFARLAPLVDAVGQCWKVDPGDARMIFSAWPAGDLDRAILRAVADEAARHPGGRFALFRPLFGVLVMNCQRRWRKRLAP
jgi:hypothetical protein